MPFSFQVLPRDTKLKHLPDQRSATNLPESRRAKQIPDLDPAVAKLKFKLFITTLSPVLILSCSFYATKFLINPWIDGGLLHQASIFTLVK